jgi:Raf kinase inhibitor-like YbhB/YbcL family protein
MKFWSDSWTNGDRMPERFAAGRPDGAGRAEFGENLNPHLAWAEVPAAAQSLVLICHDFDVPADAALVNTPECEIPVDTPRGDFFHWVMVDLPPEPLCIEEGSCSRGFTAGGKPGPAALRGARQGLNDYTRWFARDPALAGRYHGYDGPFPPWNDTLVHHYVFTLYALVLPRLPVEGAFGGAEVRQALAGRVLAEATFSGTYTLNARLLAARA